MPTLRDYLEAHKIRPADFARQINKARAYVHRYTKKGTIPKPDEIVTIYIKTNGEVEPNDWYNLPKLPLNRPHQNTT